MTLREQFRTLKNGCIVSLSNVKKISILNEYCKKHNKVLTIRKIGDNYICTLPINELPTNYLQPENYI